MPYPKKKQRITVGDVNSAEAAAADPMTAVANQLSVDLLADIFGFLSGPKESFAKATSL